jgi:hypothetical protein
VLVRFDKVLVDPQDGRFVPVVDVTEGTSTLGKAARRRRAVRADPEAAGQNPEKQALQYSGKKKAHSDRNVVLVALPRKWIDFLSRTYTGKIHDKKITDQEGIAYPPRCGCTRMPASRVTSRR